MENYKNKSKEELIQIIEKLQKTSDNPEHVSEINIHGILSSINDFVFVFDAEQRFTFVNIPDSQKLYVSSDEFSGKKHHEVMPDEMHHQFEQAFEKNRQGEFSTYDYQLEIKNELFYYSARMSPIFKDKIFQGSVAVVSDISVEKNIKRNLNKEQEFSNKILETSNAIIVGLDKNHRIQLFNKSAEKISGYNNEEVIGKDWFKLFFPENILDEMNIVWEKHWGTESAVNTNVIRIKSGEERMISWQATGFYDDEDKNKHMLISIGEDVTSKIEIQNKLLESENQFRSMFKHHHAIMLLIDPKTGSIIDANSSAEAFYGYPTDTLCKLNIADINCLSPKDLKQKLHSAEQKNDSRFIFQHKLSNNEIKTVEVHSEPIKVKDRNLLFSVIHDISDRIKAETELIEQKNKIQSIFRSAPIGIGVVSNRIVTHVNDRFCEICGYSSDELINHSAEIVYPTKEEYELVGKEKYKQIQQHGTGTVETQFKRKDGRIIDVLLSSTPIDLNELNKGVTFTALDISEIKKAQKELKLSETKFRLLADHTYDWEYWIDTNSQYVYLSPACKRITGYTPDEFKNSPNLLYEMVHPDYKEKVHIHYQDENNIHTPVFTMEFPIINKAGNEIWISHYCSPVFDADGKFLGRRGNNRDITETKIAEKKLFESETKFRNVFKNALVGFTLTGIDGSLNINKAFADILGYTIEELQNQNWTEITHPDDIDESNAVVKSLLDGKITNAKFEKRYIHKKGHTVYVIMNVFLQKDYTGKAEYFIGAVVDITEKKQAEQELAESELKFRSFFENNQAMMLEINPETKKIVNCNKKAIEFYGYEEEDFLNKQIYDINTMEKSEIDKKMTSALQHAAHFSRFQHKLANQAVKDVDVYASPVKIGDKKHMFILVIDITNNLKNEKELEIYRNNLEETVKERTTELEEQNKKLEEYNDLFIGREFRIKELRDKVKELEAKL